MLEKNNRIYLRKIMTIIFSRKTCPYYKMCTSFSKKNNCHLFKLLNHCIIYSTNVFSWFLMIQVYIVKWSYMFKLLTHCVIYSGLRQWQWNRTRQQCSVRHLRLSLLPPPYSWSIWWPFTGEWAEMLSYFNRNFTY